MLSANTDEFLKSVKDFSEGIDKSVLHLRADRVDKILNLDVIPSVGLHLSLIGTCAIVAGFPKNSTTYILFCSIAAAIFISHLALTRIVPPRVGVLGACAAFVTASAVSAPIGVVPSALVLGGAYAVVALLVVVRRIDPKELLFAPFYSALMIYVSHFSPDGLLLFSPLFGISIIALTWSGNMTVSPGLFVGFILILSYEIDHHDLNEFVLAGICALGLVSLLVYIVRTVEVLNSNLRNFLSQGLASLTILVILTIFENELKSPWIWPATLGFFFGGVHLFRGREGLATSISWFCIAVTAAIWRQSGDSLPWSGSWDTRVRLVATLAVAEGLFIAGEALRNRFAGNVARLLFLGVGGLCFALTNAVNSDLLAYLKNYRSGSSPELAEMLRWNSGALAVACALVLLSALGAALSYESTFAIRPVPWWRGLVKPRHAVLARTGFRILVKWLASVPILGALLKVLQAGPGALRYLKTGAEPFRFADLTVLVSTVTLGLSLTNLSDATLVMMHAVRFGVNSPPHPPDLAWISHSIAWTSCAVLLYGYGLLRHQSLFLLTGAILMFVPIVWYVGTTHSVRAQELGILALIAGITMVFCRMIRGGLEGPGKLEVGRNPHASPSDPPDNDRFLAA